MAMSSLWKLSTTPRPRQSTGNVLHNMRCVGHSAIPQEGDTIKNVSASRDKRKTDKGNLKSLPGALHFRSFKNSEIFLLSIDTRCRPVEPRQVMPPIRSSCLPRRSTAHASYSSSDFQVLSTASQVSCGTRTSIRPQTNREGVDYRRREMQRKSISRIGRNSLKPVIPSLYQEPSISQCAGITPVSEQGKEPMKFHEVKIKTPLFRQHYEVMFQDAPWRHLRSSNKRPLTVSSRRAQHGLLATVPSSTCLEAPCCTPDTLQLELHLEGLQLRGTWLNSNGGMTQGTRTSGAAAKDRQLVAVEKQDETGYNGKLENERTLDAASSDLVSPNESVGSTRWDPGQFKVTVTKKQSWA
ncbi:uncharacterized protein LOC134089667 [Sardina pilchardus]|uniref:uncharacterized protein LOC134089667 n=1 Tax=Sardina pilchardus TaxID=27697 RepID=UPI002E0EF8A3